MNTSHSLFKPLKNSFMSSQLLHIGTTSYSTDELPAPVWMHVWLIASGSSNLGALIFTQRVHRGSHVLRFNFGRRGLFQARHYQTGVCPHQCNSCVWVTGKYKTSCTETLEINGDKLWMGVLAISSGAYLIHGSIYLLDQKSAPCWMPCKEDANQYGWSIFSRKCLLLAVCPAPNAPMCKSDIINAM